MSDHAQAGREANARKHLLAAGAAKLPRAPWLHRNQPPSATDLTHFALWKADEDSLAAALTLLSAARAEVDQLEAGVLFAARAQGFSWPRISQEMGFASAQAAQQRFDRVSGRVGGRKATP